MNQDFININDRLTDYNNIDLLVQKIEHGGFGIVAIGPDSLRNNTIRVIKTFRPDVFRRAPYIRDLFMREALVWIGMWPHPNIVYAQGILDIHDQPAIILAYARDGSLRSWLEEHALSIDTAIVMAQQIAAGLIALHNPDTIMGRVQPMIHRDLKPENILLDRDLCMIGDLGLAKVLAGDDRVADKESLYPATNSLHTRGAGTLQYKAPEQIKGEGDLTPAIDIYAAGLIFSELFAGRHALLDLNVQYHDSVWKNAHLHQRPRPLRDVALSLPLEIEDLYQAMLEKSVMDRPTAVQVFETLHAVALKAFPGSAYEPVIRPHTAENEAVIRMNVASVWRTSGDFDQALAMYQQAIDLNPLDALARSNLGTILDLLNRHDEAIETYRRALELDPQLYAAWYNMGNTLFSARRDSEAIEAYHQVLAHDPHNLSAWNNLGNSLSGAGRYQEAIDAYRQVLAMAPDHANARFNLAVGLAGSGQLEASLTELDQCDQADAGLWDFKAVIYRQMGNEEMTTQAEDVARRLRGAQ